MSLFTPTVRNVNPNPIKDHVWCKLWTPWRLTDQALLMLGLGAACGLRRGEMAGLRGEQINGDMIVSFVRKGGGEASLPWRSMLEIQAEGLPNLFSEHERFGNVMASLKPGPVLGFTDPSEVNKLLGKIARRRQLEQHVHPHMLRHTAATNLLRCDVPVHLVSTLMNHGSITTTMRYVASGQDQLAEWRRRGA
jgi:integrase